MPKTILTNAAALLREGGLVALPTETVYGLGANALDPAAVARIYQVKGRPGTSPLIVHVATIAMARELVREWSEEADLLARRYWPGPLTLVVPKHPRVPDIVTSGLDTVGVRMPAHPVTLELIRLAGVPVAAPSANRFQELSPTTAQHVRDSLGDEVDLIVDGGPCEVGIESAVLALSHTGPMLLRPGMISRQELELALGRDIAEAGAVQGAHPSPGMGERHYSPRTPVALVSGGALPSGRGAYLWWRTEAAAEWAIRMPGEPGAYARALYGELHRADEAGLEWIAVEALPDGPEWAGVSDRLKRASAPKTFS
ncbi:MAG TPA: L-threonylcarbamoyladenylate synthase [Bryobacteraceae bacterium]|nr:L-threonylcarbamoyladenylate synthase [Bryobacteraceae bacterium]